MAERRQFFSPPGDDIKDRNNLDALGVRGDDAPDVTAPSNPIFIILVKKL